MSAFLDIEDVKKLTGYVRVSYQLKYCREHGIPAWPSAAGECVIPVAAIEGRRPPANDEGWTPDFTKVAGRG